WSRRLTVVDLSIPQDAKQAPLMTVRKTVSLPFAPREQVLVRGDAKLLVADSHGGKLAILDAADGTLEAVRELPAHNIRGLCATPDGRKLLERIPQRRFGEPADLDGVLLLLASDASSYMTGSVVTVDGGRTLL
ncbi:MAG: SDR family oxidoreductase, partial [Gemmatimonadetes bacterium]|nr:SDR family oxidoreductase [Gemmatimonadota bacterium]